MFIINSLLVYYQFIISIYKIMTHANFTKEQQRELYRCVRGGFRLSVNQIKKLCQRESPYIIKIIKRHLDIRTCSNKLNDYAIEAYCAIDTYDYREVIKSVEFKNYMRAYERFEAMRLFERFEAMRVLV